MENRMLFKVIFWLLGAVAFVFLTIMSVFLAYEVVEMPGSPRLTVLIIIFAALILFLIFTGISVFIYKDARKHGLNEWMWMTIAVFIPNLIGLILYIIIRSTRKRKCISCGKSVEEDFDICPYCGKTLALKCTSCGMRISSDWKVCPYCKEDI